MHSSGISTVYQLDTVTDRFLDNFPVHCHFRNGPIGQNSMHAHRGYELYFCLEGQGMLLVGDRVYPLQPGAFIFIKPHVLHWPRVSGTTALHRVVLSIDDRFVAELRDSVPAFETCIRYVLAESTIPSAYWLLNEEETESIHKILIRLTREITGKAPFFEAAIHHLLIEMLVILAREQQQWLVSSQESDNSSFHLAERVLQYLATHYAESIEVSRLHERFNVSRSYLYEHFKQWTGQSLNRYLTLYRINQAKRLLMDTSLSVTEIAASSGFGDLSHFFHTFKTEAGKTPNEFRKQYTNHAQH